MRQTLQWQWTRNVCFTSPGMYSRDIWCCEPSSCQRMSGGGSTDHTFNKCFILHLVSNCMSQEDTYKVIITNKNNKRLSYRFLHDKQKKPLCLHLKIVKRTQSKAEHKARASRFDYRGFLLSAKWGILILPLERVWIWKILASKDTNYVTILNREILMLPILDWQRERFFQIYGAFQPIRFWLKHFTSQANTFFILFQLQALFSSFTPIPLNLKPW